MGGTNGRTFLLTYQVSKNSWGFGAVEIRNLYELIGEVGPGEINKVLLETETFRLERIVSD